MRLFAATLLGALALSAGSAVACSCLMTQSAGDHLAQTQAELVFTGRVVRTRTFRDGTAATTFRPMEILRGRAGRSVVIRHGVDGAACGVRYAKGQTALVIADRGSVGVRPPARESWGLNPSALPLRTSLCSQPQFSLAEYRRAVVRAGP